MQSFYRLILKLNSKTEIHSGGYIYNLENGYPKYAAGYEKMLDLGFSDIRGIARNTTEEFTCRKDYPVRTDDDVYINGTMPMYTIDYIFAYGDGLKAEKFDIITSQKALNSSDHCPLILDFEIK